jgi:hypothetical protein
MFEIGDLVKSKVLTIHDWGVGVIIDKKTYKHYNPPTPWGQLPDRYQTLYRIKWRNEPKGYDENRYIPSTLYCFNESCLENI